MSTGLTIALRRFIVSFTTTVIILPYIIFSFPDITIQALTNSWIINFKKKSEQEPIRWPDRGILVRIMVWSVWSWPIERLQPALPQFDQMAATMRTDWGWGVSRAGQSRTLPGLPSYQISNGWRRGVSRAAAPSLLGVQYYNIITSRYLDIYHNVWNITPIRIICQFRESWISLSNPACPACLMRSFIL